MAFVVCTKERRNEGEGREGTRFVIEMWRHFRLKVFKFFIVFSLSIYIIVYILSIVNIGKFHFLPILLLLKQFFPLFLTKKSYKDGFTVSYDFVSSEIEDIILHHCLNMLYRIHLTFKVCHSPIVICIKSGNLQLSCSNHIAL